MAASPSATLGETLAVRSISKSYGEHSILRDFSLEVAAGEFVTLLGPSGSGKTTILMAVAGFVPIDSGQILLGGRDFSALPPHKRGLGVVFQSYLLFPHMTVRENVAFPLTLRGTPRAEIAARVAETLELVGLKDLEERLPRQLSGGQQQRAALARALVFRPAVLLMDEPLGALDKKLREQMQFEIKAIQRRLGVTILYVTHDQEEAMYLSDRIVVMQGGRIEQMGTAQELYGRPASRFVAEFLGDANVLEGRVVAAAGEREVEIELESGLRMWSAGNRATPGSRVTMIVRSSKVRVCEPDFSADGFKLMAEGEIEDIAYVRNSVRMRVRVPAVGGTLQVQHQDDLVRGGSLGTPRVHLAYQPRDVWLIAQS
jgi:putative spermidine/putrescine transport system ATP-binding protein/mannopine transport system ATP-binding protein